MEQIEVLYVGGPMHGTKTKVDGRASLKSAMVTQPDNIAVYEHLLITDGNGDEVKGWYVMDYIADMLPESEVLAAIYAADLRPVVEGIRVERGARDGANA
jgi:hypothetical protein